MTDDVIHRHLVGTDERGTDFVAGVYPMLLARIFHPIPLRQPKSFPGCVMLRPRAPRRSRGRLNVYSTALVVMTLGAPNQLLPIFQR